ncbi:PAS domain S-box protein [Spongiibacter sp. KMU-166]|uniref:histidine kinase n=1 Tax=Spongiibacter thalassae TaxID=2721624 RepID=A0ABX1GAP4_9GAMM|nr:PAS domain S-box protein [Spongiibacter thalassae]NKI16234.1 PAS domain S-box protein [Spongiibacter thalassae]
MMSNREDVKDLLNRTKAIVETIVDGVITIDHQGLIDTVNPATEKIFGYQAEELIGRNVSMLMPDPYQREHDGYIGNYLNTGQKKIIGIGREVSGQRKDGSIFPLELAISEMVVNEQRMFTGVVRDISQRKETEEKLRAAMRRVHEQRIKDEFIATVSHELRTPLTSIKGSLELIRSGSVGAVPEQVSTLIEIARKNSERLLLLINDILDISKIESEQMNYRMIRIPVRAFLESAISDNRAYGSQHSVEFRLGNCSSKLNMYADPDRMMQVMNNLMSNAAKFSKPDSHVELSAQECDGGVRICVKDEGCGIPATFKSRIFDKFTQADSSDQRQISGTGLGLHISKAIVEQHGGSLSFHSELHQGTEFYIDLKNPFSDEAKPDE